MITKEKSDAIRAVFPELPDMTGEVNRVALWKAFRHYVDSSQYDGVSACLIGQLAAHAQVGWFSSPPTLVADTFGVSQSLVERIYANAILCPTYARAMGMALELLVIPALQNVTMARLYTAMERRFCDTFFRLPPQDWGQLEQNILEILERS